MRKSFSLIAVLVCAVLCTQISAYAAEAEPDVSAISNAEIVSVSEESTIIIFILVFGMENNAIS